MGRIFNGAGEPRDKGPALAENLIPIGGPSVNPANRIIPREMIRTGIPMIDLFNTLVKSQKLPIFSVSGEPYNQLLARIAMQAEVDLIILGGMGLKYDDYLFFKDTLEAGRRPVRRPSCSCIPPPTPSSSASWFRTSPWPWRSASPSRAGTSWCS